jgi:phosphatidylglycerophosphatase GEP4
MGQSWNAPAVRAAASALRGRAPPGAAQLPDGAAHPLLPQLSVPTLSDVSAEALHRRGVRGVILDKDNTITAPYVDEVHPRAAPGLHALLRTFPGNVAILSNSAGTPDDSAHAQARRIERTLGVPVIRHEEKKPGGLSDVLDHFEGRVAPHELAVVGDRLLTDVYFGNVHGMYTVHVGVLTLTGDNKAAALVRFLENRVILPWVLWADNTT